VSAARSRSCELIIALALAFSEALPLQAWLLGPHWPDPWPLLGLMLVAISVRFAAEHSRGRYQAWVLLGPCLILAVLRLPLGVGAALLAFGAAAWQAVRAAQATTARPDPAQVFGRGAVAFLAIIAALALRRTDAIPAGGIIAAQLVVSGIAAVCAGQLELGRHGLPIGQRTAIVSVAQIGAAVIILAVLTMLILTPQTLSLLVLRPLVALRDLLARAVILLLTPLARVLMAVVLYIKHHSRQYDPGTIGAGSQPDPAGDTSEAAVSVLAAQIAAAIVLVIAAWIVWRLLRAALTRLRSDDRPQDGMVTVTRLAAGVGQPGRPSWRPVGAATERLGSSASDQVRLLYRRVLAGASAIGCTRRATETPSSFAARLARASGEPDDTEQLTRAYEDVRYGARSPSRERLAELKHASERISVGLGRQQRSSGNYPAGSRPIRQ
jgi:hypothetical protein